MKSTMKLVLTLVLCIFATAYCAEKPLNADKIIREAHASGKPIPAATVNQMLEQQKKSFEQDAMEFRSLFGQTTPTKTNAQANPQTAALAHAHNRKLHNEQQIKIKEAQSTI